MIEIVNKINKLEDLGNKIPESLLLIDRYKRFFDVLDSFKN
jgi:hypothetical protein